MMKLIVGLGNPGSAYAGSRHNVGFMVVKKLARLHKIALKRDSQSYSLSGRGTIEGKRVVLALPLTFMNLSGQSIACLVERYRVGKDGLLVICDDLDLETGRIKIRPEGSSAGHRGLDSAINALGTNEFLRLRIGIGRPSRNIDAADFVLSPFDKEEKKQIKDSLERAVDCCRMWLAKGIAASMNNFNKRSN